MFILGTTVYPVAISQTETRAQLCLKFLKKNRLTLHVHVHVYFTCMRHSYACCDHEHEEVTCKKDSDLEHPPVHCYEDCSEQTQLEELSPIREALPRPACTMASSVKVQTVLFSLFWSKQFTVP